MAEKRGVCGKFFSRVDQWGYSVYGCFFVLEGGRGGRVLVEVVIGSVVRGRKVCT